MGGRDRSYREADRFPALPFVPGEVSNGEFVPQPASPVDRAIVRETLRRAEEAAQRVGMDRRRFLQTTGGMAAMLAVVNLAACSSPSDPTAASPGSSPATGSTGGPVPTAPGGTFAVPPAEDTEACAQVLENRGEFILDVHTHHVMPEGPWRRSAPGIAAMIREVIPPSCTHADPFRCVDRTAYVQDLFLASDTTVALLSDVPNSGPEDAPVPFTDAVGTHELASSLSGGGADRVLVQSILAPNFGELAPHLDTMSQQVETGKVSCFKVYTAWGPGRRGYALDDPTVGIPVVEHARDLGVKVICAHKGLPIQGFDERFNGPADVVRVAARYPDMQFVIYHSAFERATTEGPYDPARATKGINSFVKALDDSGIPPGANVWADLGTTWREVMSAPTQAAHAIGKLLARLGPDRVLWGTDAVWYGSPQPQIMAFRAFEISEQFQQQYGYPALTPEIKRKVFGLNAAKLFGLDVDETRCAVDGTKLAQARPAFASLVEDGYVDEPWRARGPLSRRDVLSWRRRTPPSDLPT